MPAELLRRSGSDPNPGGPWAYFTSWRLGSDPDLCDNSVGMTEPQQTSKRPYRPPIGIPSKGEPRAQATAAALALHVLLILLVLLPTVLVGNQLIDYVQQGAGGPGPAGGGGGGNQSFPGRIKYFPERVDFMKLETEAVVVPKKEEIVKPKEEIKPPPPPPTPDPPPQPTVTDSAVNAAVRVDSSAAMVGASLIFPDRTRASDLLVAELDPTGKQAIRPPYQKGRDDAVGDRIAQPAIFLRQENDDCHVEEAQQHTTQDGAAKRAKAADHASDEGLDHRLEAESRIDAAAPRDDEDGRNAGEEA